MSDFWAACVHTDRPCRAVSPSPVGSHPFPFSRSRLCLREVLLPYGGSGGHPRPAWQPDHAGESELPWAMGVGVGKEQGGPALPSQPSGSPWPFFREVMVGRRGAISDGGMGGCMCVIVCVSLQVSVECVWMSCQHVAARTRVCAGQCVCWCVHVCMSVCERVVVSRWVSVCTRGVCNGYGYVCTCALVHTHMCTRVTAYAQVC